jgi:hypothetical protein
MVRKLSCIALAIASLSIVMPSHATVTRTETKRYIGSLDWIDVCDDYGLGAGIGGACFDIAPSEVGQRVTIVLADDRFTDVAANYWFDLEGEPIALFSEVFCNRRTTVVPRGAVRLEVAMTAALNATPLACDQIAPATTGSVSITLWTP